MASTILEQFRIADLIEWYDNKKLKINKRFQRKAVWTKPAKVYLIDTILRSLPVPKMYMRTKVNVKTKKSYRELVDGQQRFLAIYEFAYDKLKLTHKAGNFSGYMFSDLDEEEQERFLSYAMSVDQLINASDNDVLEIFSRLNSYTVRLNNQEMRHARYQGAFKWSVFETSRTISSLLEEYGVFTTRQRLRMLDDQLIAEMYGVVLEGVTDGGQNNIDKLYRKYDKEDSFDKERIENIAIKVNNFIIDKFSDLLLDYPTFANAPHYLMLFAATSHLLYGIPKGQMGDKMPSTNMRNMPNLTNAYNNLEIIANIIDADDVPDGFIQFYNSVKSTTQRISSRRVRFPIYFYALINDFY